MKIHILGICGTFMGGIAQIARQFGCEVSGCDAGIYPPMSDQLEAAGITLTEGYEGPIPENCEYIVGNAMSRGNPAVESLMRHRKTLQSGPEWLSQKVLRNKHVLAVAGTHGKTTTTSLLTWILECGGKNPGFLVGGVPENFGYSARLTDSEFFVIEADEYDTAFYDKRPKFMHYSPSTVILNNLEFDHADIYDNLDQIKKQFHYLVRTIPGNGRIVVNAEDANLEEVLSKGCWSEVASFGLQQGNLQAKLIASDGSVFEVLQEGNSVGVVHSPLLGLHNVANQLAALSAAEHVGVSLIEGIEAIRSFKNVKRRLEVLGSNDKVTAYDDFAHHPTAITQTLHGLRQKIGKSGNIIAILELGSHTMQSGIHFETLSEALKEANQVLWKMPTKAQGAFESMQNHLSQESHVFASGNAIAAYLQKQSFPHNSHLVLMSNKGFDGLPQWIRSHYFSEKAIEVEHANEK